MGAESGIDPRLSWTGRRKALELAKLTREWEPPLEEKLEKLRMQKEDWARKMEMKCVDLFCCCCCCCPFRDNAEETSSHFSGKTR